MRKYQVSSEYLREIENKIKELNAKTGFIFVLDMENSGSWEFEDKGYYHSKVELVIPGYEKVTISNQGDYGDEKGVSDMYGFSLNIIRNEYSTSISIDIEQFTPKDIENMLTSMNFINNIDKVRNIYKILKDAESVLYRAKSRLIDDYLLDKSLEALSSIQ